jgi:ketosteroid isomerase-like protein
MIGAHVDPPRISRDRERDLAVGAGRVRGPAGPEDLADRHAERLARSTVEAIERFNAAFNQHDVDGVMRAMTEDCVFENTYPPPDGERHAGQAAVRAFWERFFASSPSAIFETEDMFATGDRCVVRWLYRWVEPDGERGHVRGVDVFRVRDGKVAEKLAYVKG